MTAIYFMNMPPGNIQEIRYVSLRIIEINRKFHPTVFLFRAYHTEASSGILSHVLQRLSLDRLAWHFCIMKFT